MLEPKEISIKNSKGVDKTYVISKIPAMPALEIAFKLPPSLIPKIGEYETYKDVVFKIMKYVGVPRGEGKEPLWLITEELINNHVDSWEGVVKIQALMVDYNSSFFREGRAFAFLGGVAQKYLGSTLGILNRFFQQLLKTLKQPSTN